MNVEEFKALKERLVERAKEALEKRGCDLPGTDNTTIRFFSMPSSVVVTYKGELAIRSKMKNYLNGVYDLTAIYKDQDGVEQPVGRTHRELVWHYRRTLDELDRALLLEDLANV